MKILELLKKARDQLGAALDIRQFHDRLLGAGGVPLDLLAARIDSGIKSVKTK